MRKTVSEFLVLFVRLYQATVSPLVGPRCRFHPSCSQYMIDALREKGPLRGLFMGVRRILKCHPFNSGGYDPVK